MATKHLNTFLADQQRIRSFLEVIATNAQRAVDDDQFRHDILVLLFIPDQQTRQNAQARMEERLQLGLGPHFELFCELVACRLVDAFEAYLSEVTMLIFSTVPGTLLVNDTASNKRTIDVSTLVDADRDGKPVKDILESIGTQKANSLSYKSLSERHRFWNTSHNFPLFSSDQDKNLASNMCDERNLIVHNRGIVNALFLERIAETGYPFQVDIGDQIKITKERMFELLELTERLVTDIYERASAKWNLPQV